MYAPVAARRMPAHVVYLNNTDTACRQGPAVGQARGFRHHPRRYGIRLWPSNPIQSNRLCPFVLVQATFL
jgi:hypothetical protein